METLAALAAEPIGILVMVREYINLMKDGKILVIKMGKKAVRLKWKRIILESEEFNTFQQVNIL